MQMGRGAADDRSPGLPAIVAGNNGASLAHRHAVQRIGKPHSVQAGGVGLRQAPAGAAIKRGHDDAAVAHEPGVLGIEGGRAAPCVQRAAVLRQPALAGVAGLAQHAAVASRPAHTTGLRHRAQVGAGLQRDELPTGAAVAGAQQCAILAADPGHVGINSLHRQGMGVGRQRIAGSLQRSTAGAYGVARQAFGAVARQVGLFVPVGIGDDAALLQPHGAVVPGRVEGVAG